ncbi:hypothetical protein CYMTET_49699 [Cymbomonas tetramitiformis]|uniref:Uncharacterized protein n=1 Tax=Cymbomonas tetramitiformis TaxID=36881 RepID=A0AAE0BRC5_9CHLO|nr:hypothetical protein CYMTET_49699 [Cymbomonas tetramitiformis]
MSSMNTGHSSMPSYMRMLAHALAIKVTNASPLKKIVNAAIAFVDCPENIKTQLQQVVQPVTVEGGLYQPKNGAQLKAHIASMVKDYAEAYCDGNSIDPLPEDHAGFVSYASKPYQRDKQSRNRDEYGNTWQQCLTYALSLRTNNISPIRVGVRRAIIYCRDHDVKSLLLNIEKNDKSKSFSNAHVLKQQIRSLLDAQGVAYLKRNPYTKRKPINKQKDSDIAEDNCANCDSNAETCDDRVESAGLTTCLNAPNDSEAETDDDIITLAQAMAWLLESDS